MPLENADDRGTLSDQNLQDKPAPPDSPEEMSAFSDAFDTATEAEAGGDGGGDDIPAPGDKPVEPVDKKDAAVSAAAPVPPPAAPPAAPQDEGTFEQRYKTLQGIHKHDRESWEAEKSQLLTKITDLEKGGDKPTAADDKKKIEDAGKLLHQVEDSLTDEERAQLATYDAEFDTVSAMEGLKRKVEMAKLRKDMMQMLEDIKNQLQPVQQFVTKTNEDRAVADRDAHFGAIGERHHDYATYRDDGSLTKWIDSQPIHVRNGLKEVCASGTVEEVISMYDQFKRDNNIPIESVADPVVDNVVKIRQARKDALRTPAGRKSAVNPSHAIAQTFDAAFDEAVTKQGG